jgi:hypothetical protein
MFSRHSVVLYVGLVEEWLNAITRCLGEAPKEDPKEKLPGPRTILDYWRIRMTRLTSITEQLKLKECKNVLGVLALVAKNERTEETVRQGVFPLHLRAYVCVRAWVCLM